MAIRDSWAIMQENRMIIIYMIVTAGVFFYIYYNTTFLKKIVEKEVVESKEPKQDTFVKKPDATTSNYAMQSFAYGRTTHHDSRDMKLTIPGPQPFI
jgi:hypothetical protein